MQLGEARIARRARGIGLEQPPPPRLAALAVPVEKRAASPEGYWRRRSAVRRAASCAARRRCPRRGRGTRSARPIGVASSAAPPQRMRAPRRRRDQQRADQLVQHGEPQRDARSAPWRCRAGSACRRRCGSRSRLRARPRLAACGASTTSTATTTQAHQRWRKWSRKGSCSQRHAPRPATSRRLRETGRPASAASRWRHGPASQPGDPGAEQQLHEQHRASASAAKPVSRAARLAGRARARAGRARSRPARRA